MRSRSSESRIDAVRTHPKQQQQQQHRCESATRARARARKRPAVEKREREREKLTGERRRGVGRERKRERERGEEGRSEGREMGIYHGKLIFPPFFRHLFFFIIFFVSNFLERKRGKSFSGPVASSPLAHRVAYEEGGANASTVDLLQSVSLLAQRGARPHRIFPLLPWTRGSRAIRANFLWSLPVAWGNGPLIKPPVGMRRWIHSSLDKKFPPVHEYIMRIRTTGTRASGL